MSTTEKKVTELKSASVEQLSADVSALKSDIAGLVETLKLIGAEGKSLATEELRARAANVETAARAKADQLQQTADQFVVQARDAVQEKPAQSLLIAAAIGAIFGFLTARK